MGWLFVLACGLVGAAVGSFLNVVIDRMPARISLVHPSSSCPACGRQLTPGDLIPVVSYLYLRGRCRTCQARIPARLLFVELATGLTFAGLAWLNGPGFELVAQAVYAALLIVIIVIDLEHKLILNRVVYPAVSIASLIAVLRLFLDRPRFLHYGYPMAAGWGSGLAPDQIGLLSQVLGALMAFGIFFLIWRISPQGMGYGDVRLAAFAGLVTGFPGALGAVFGSFILGGVFAAALLIAGRVSRKTAIPFGPFLSITTFVLIVWGDHLLMLYLFG